ncbi:MAG: acetylxylan esterase, partial [Thermoguttaceae bacterium]|nr:acetylxylan esterase [Thermoguttaceae bacterium]
KDVSGNDVVVETQKVYYQGEPFEGHPTRVMAFFSRPEGDGPFPGMVLIHGGGGSAFSVWTEMWAARGYAAIAMDLYGDEIMSETSTEGWDIDRKRMEDGGPNLSDPTMFSAFPAEGDAYKDKWPYHCIANIMLAHSLLDSLPCVDADRTGATGISWGGYLSALIAGIDDRFQVIVPVYGCGAMTSKGFEANHFHQNMSEEEIKVWDDFFEPNGYLPNTKCKVFYVDGTNDFAFPLAMHKTSWERTPNADVRLQIDMPHSHSSGWNPQEIGNYVDWVLKNAPPLPCLDIPEVFKTADGKVTISAKIKYGSKPVEAHFNYTTDPDEYAQNNKQIRSWVTIPAEISENMVSVQLPEELMDKTVDCYLDAVDAAGNMASSHYSTVRP